MKQREIKLLISLEFKKCFDLCNRPRFFDSLFSKKFMWSVQLRCSSTKTLKNFIDDDRFMEKRRTQSLHFRSNFEPPFPLEDG